MIRTIRALFLSRPLREKILLVALVAVLAIWWLTNLGGRAALFWTEQRNTSLELADQASWLAQRDPIIASATQAASKLDPARTFDSNRLLATVTALAHDAGLNNTTSSEPQEVRSGQFAVHTLPFNVSRADWASLKAFYLALQHYWPHIGIEQFSIQADRGNPAQLNAALRVSSVEIAHP